MPNGTIDRHLGASTQHRGHHTLAVHGGAAAQRAEAAHTVKTDQRGLLEPLTQYAHIVGRVAKEARKDPVAAWRKI